MDSPASSVVVLVVEDDLDLSRELARLLELFGFRVKIADSLANARSAFNGSEAFVFLDGGFPDADVSEVRGFVAEILCKPGFNGQVIAISGNADSNRKLLDAGCHQAVFKPKVVRELPNILVHKPEDTAKAPAA